MDIDKDDPQLEDPSCYTLLAFLGKIGLYPSKDLGYRGGYDGAETYLRGKLSATLPFTAEWDSQSNTDFNIDFSGVTIEAIVDVVEKLSDYGIVFSNASFDSIDTIPEIFSQKGIEGIFGGKLGTFSLSKYQLNNAVLLHDRREHARKASMQQKCMQQQGRRNKKYRKLSGSPSMPYY